ncbi:secretin N-terminal domain-containing protein [Planctomicrobium piriforme]|uniref:LTXXQ motif family protein n=1 Tax=Planctomicrobium piriforme TaxID=1576369 RepID=A0A1I3IJK8_9PLAN|nr:secretin N-terminal domain-containing protein [Planctomicrobium piriforme]SFI48059.1 LTXXQ motif family protein [Planctomicrobium piriforme]
MPTYSFSKFARRLLLALCTASLLTGDLLAQDGGRGGPGGGFSGRGGFGGPPGGFSGRGGGGRGGLLGELSNDATRAELKVTDEQKQKIDALSEAQRGNRDQFGDVMQRMQSAQTEEERNQIRDEMRKRFEEMSKQTDAQVKGILTADQAKRLDQLRLHREGPGAFGRDSELATEFGLTDEQKQKFQTLSEERMAARFAMGRGSSDEDRAKFDQEWAAKYLAVLTPEQQTKWKDRLGPPPADSAPTGAAATPAATPAVTAPAKPRTVIIEAVPEGAKAVASFGAPAAMNSSPADPNAPAAADVAKATDGPKKMSFNFRYAPWTEVLKMFAEEAGLSLDLNALPPGTFNYYDQGQYTATEALDILNGYLLPKGYCLIRRDEFLVCVNIDEPIPPSLVPIISTDDIDKRGRNELLTVIFPLEGVDIEQVASEVNDIKGPQGKVVGLKSTNSILVTDIGSNLRRIRNLLADVTARGGPNDITFKAYQVKNVPVSDAETIVRSLLGITVGATNVSSVTEGRRDPRSPPPAAPRVDPHQARVTTDLRTNQLLVTATLGQHLLVEQALKTVDVPGDASQFSPSSTKPFLKVYNLTSSDPREVTKTIDALMPGIVVNEDARNGKIHIQASPDQHRQVEMLIAQMEGMGGGRQMAVIPLSTLDPVSVTGTIRSMFLKEGDAAPTVEADLYGRQLMIRGTADQLTQIRTLLTQLGEDGTGQRRDSLERVRTIPLSGRDPAELLPLIERMWTKKNGAGIRVVNPPSSGNGTAPSMSPPTSQRTPEQRHPLGDAPTTQRGSVMSPASGRIPVLTAAQTTVINNDGETAPQSDLAKDLDALLGNVESKPAAQSTPAAGNVAPSEPRADVSITIMGDELVITSSDPKQLDELQDLLNQTMQALPPRITWTVFTLQAADATEAANMLKLLFPGTTVAASSSSTSSSMFGSLGSGASSLGSSLMDMTGLGTLGSTQQLKIIPDLRLNALFVAGPAAQVREVEEMLKVLDSTSLGGDSLRDKLSRMIPINHANAQDVYNIVKEVYKNYIDPPRMQDNNNPLAMFAAGGGGRGGRNETPPPASKLAIGVDTNSSNLIVWADEPLFREIEELVQSLDTAAEDARRTVRVVTLENTSSAVMQNALGSLMPQVKVSTTGSRSGSTTSSTPSSGSPIPSPSSSGAPNSDQMRQFFEQRMRDRGTGGGGTGGGQGGFGGGGFGNGGFGGGMGGGGFGGGGAPGGGFGGGGFGGGRGGNFGGGGGGGNNGGNRGNR